jgi:nucleoporin NUP159
MSVASQKGLVAAAGPDVVIVATTESVRKAFEGPDSGDGNLKPFQPQLKLPMPMRVSQLAFSADESYLVLSAETGGGLAVYDVQALLQGSTQSAFELSTNGQALRALAPNPTPEKGELLALVTTDGNLMMANLKERSFVSGPNGQVLKTGVSCVSWSTKGKQLVAGLGDGTAYQMTPEGEGKAEIPRPPNVDGGDHGKLPHGYSPSIFNDFKVSSITWLENHVFLVVHTPSSFDNSQAPQSTFHVITRQPPANFTFQKVSDPAGPFGLNRSPPHHFILRLKDFPPNLQDIILVASTASIDIGLFSRSKVPLTSDKPADKISGVFTMTEMSDDSRRAQLPMTGELTDTSPIGFALDLSSKEKVPKPIPADEMDESPTPLPALMVLNNEGVLASWWVIYSESIRQGTVYPGLIIAGGASQPTQPSPAPIQAPASAFGAPSKPAFGAPVFGSTAPAFGSTTSSAFGAPSLPGSTSGAFGGPSALGKSQSPWGTPAASSAPSTNTLGTFGSTPSTAASKPAFGAPSFGTTSTPTFGLGNRASPWATGGSTAPNAAFGQAGGLAKSASVFGVPASTTSTPATSSGFAAFASKGGFAAAGAASSPTGSIFGSKPASNAFGSPSADSSMDKGSIFGGAAKKAENKPTFGSGGFVLGSTFKADPTAKDDIPDTSNEPKTSFFPGGFSNALVESSKSASVEAPVSEETEMDSDDLPKPELSAKAETTTPISTPAAPKSQLFGSTTPASGLFGTPAISSTPTTKPASTGFSFGQQITDKPKPAGFSFANLNATSSSTPKTPTTTGPPSSSTPAITPSSPKIKQEPRPETPPLNKKIPAAPLPPDSTSKTSYAAGESSASSVEPDAPLPPDFIPKAAARPKQPPESPIAKKAPEKPIPADLIPPVDVPGGPDDEGDDDSDFETEEEGEDGSEDPSEEGSGEDVAKDLSPTSEANQTPGFTPQSSFGGTKNRGPESSMFTKVSKPGEAQPQRSLFGEIGSSAPMLPPPRVQQSPRSPSPVRTAVPPRMRPDASRSVSAPGAASQASQILGSQRIGGRPNIPVQKTQAVSHEEANQQAEAKRRAESRARKEAEETQTLVDADDDRMQEFLASDLKVTTTLDEFVAHSDYVGDKSMESIPAQVETVYRDINSMIDTLGVNARALKCFIQGHTEQYKDEGRTIEDLELGDDKEGWCLVEIEDLSNLVEINLARELENSRVVELAAKLETCNDLQKDLIRLRAKHEDVKKIIDCYRDPSHLAIARAQPLSAEQAAQQHDLRRDFTKFQKLLSEAEEGLTVLKAKTVSQATSNGKANGSGGPTVEAVMRTITKMTSMAEKRSGDIDVLEGQMRRLRFSSATSAGSREGSPFATPQNNKISLRNPGTSSTYGLFYTPDSIKDTPQRFQNSLMSSIGSQSRNSPPRRKLSGYTTEEKAQLKMKLARKKEVTNKLRAALQKAGTNVRLMDDDDE